jgi:hypothetical protein
MTVMAYACVRTDNDPMSVIEKTGDRRWMKHR